MFMDLLQLKKQRVIFSVFTRSGNVLVCKSRDSAPIRVADPETVRQLSESCEHDLTGQRRFQTGGSGGPPGRTPGGALPGRARADVAMPPDVGAGGRERELLSPGGAAGAPRLDLLAGPPESSGAAVRGGSPDGGDVRRRQPSSSLLDCAREPVRQVHLMAPLSAPLAADVATGSPAAGGRRLLGSRSQSNTSHPSVGAGGSPRGGSSLDGGAALSPRSSMVVDDEPAGAQPRLYGDGALESPSQATSDGMSPSVPASGERGERGERGEETDFVKPFGEDEGNLPSTQSTSGALVLGYVTMGLGVVEWGRVWGRDREL